MLLAHSAKPEKDIPVHGYAAHIGGTVSRALKAAKAAAFFAFLGFRNVYSCGHNISHLFFVVVLMYLYLILLGLF